MTPFFRIITLWELSVAMETRVLIQSGSKILKPFPHPYDASDKISFQSAYWLQRYSCLKVLTDARIRSRAANSVVRGRIRPNFELSQALMHVIVTCKYKKEPIKNIQENVMTPFFPIITLWELSVAMETRVLIQSGSKILKPFSHPNDASDKISFQSACWLQRYSCFKVLTDARTHGRRLDWYTISSPCESSAQVS